jgi:hypothetical protein
MLFVVSLDFSCFDFLLQASFCSAGQTGGSENDVVIVA